MIRLQTNKPGDSSQPLPGITTLSTTPGTQNITENKGKFFLGKNQFNAAAGSANCKFYLNYEFLSRSVTSI